MPLEFLLERFRENPESDAIIWKNDIYSYRWLLDRIDHWRGIISSEKIEPGTVVVLEADFSPNAVALFLTLLESKCIVVPLTSRIETKKQEFTEIAQGEVSFRIDEQDQTEIVRLKNQANHEFYGRLRKLGDPGLVLFSSGSTGKNKAAVHNMARLLGKFMTRRHNLRTLTFLLFDHIGGIDTMLYSLSNASCIITVSDRAPENVCRTIERFGVEVLPVTPTFLNLLILSHAYEKHDLSSLKYITYGTEIMSEVTLKRTAEIFPGITLLQKYGTSETGTLRSKSKSSESIWVKIGGEGYQTRIVDGILQIKAESAMLGYLNAPSPFTDDGWFVTGDEVERDGEYIRFLGRRSEIINVGGEKVYPSQVENTIQDVDNVLEVVVYGEKNPLIGNIVCARIRLAEEEDEKQAAARIKQYCREVLENYMVPVKIEFVRDKQHSQRFKKTRKPPGDNR